MKKTKTMILAMVIAMLAGCGRAVKEADNSVATPSASATPIATVEPSAEPTESAEATVEPTAEASPDSEAVQSEPTAEPEQISTPAPTPEATSEPTAIAEPSDNATTSTSTSGDDCGWIADYSMTDGGYCSLHPEWYGGAVPSSNQSSDTQTATAAEPTYEAPAATTSYSGSSNLGDAGNLTIPDVGINVAMNYGGQAAVNPANSAAELQYGNEFIADHAYQGFNKITNCTAGTMVYITRPSGQVDTYQVTAILYTDGVIHYDEAGFQHVYLTDGRDCMNDYIADLCLQTCANGGGDWIVTCTRVY